MYGSSTEQIRRLDGVLRWFRATLSTARPFNSSSTAWQLSTRTGEYLVHQSVYTNRPLAASQCNAINHDTTLPTPALSTAKSPPRYLPPFIPPSDSHIPIACIEIPPSSHRPPPPPFPSRSTSLLLASRTISSLRLFSNSARSVLLLLHSPFARCACVVCIPP